MFYVLISIAAGAIVVISRILNTKLSETVGLIESSFFNYLTGIFAALILFLIFRDTITLSQLYNIPAYAYLGGILGVVIVILNSVITPKMSSFYATLIIFIGQLFTGIIIDWITFKTLPFAKIVGGFLVVAGLAYNLHVDSEAEKSAEPN
ncbi:protein of unknown function DUF606 [Clostridium sp. DL-VIII]|uniref:DMT family transporter n=1 Tax=Clostridium sp. DL-VIII TaxID=641107 RepID=UPI00023B00EC|nr:DMT family transporter [Clostridium sp. DL-VIII]EHI99819.1 protein of unknown function DUF606 [Clostridium sp. DL-VIII]